MWKDRLKRLLILLLVAVLFFFVGKVFANWLAKNKVAGASISLPTQQIGEKISDFGEQVLGKVIEILPVSGELKQKIVATPTPASAEIKTEEKIVNVETKTQEIIEIIKELPAQVLENIKKQIFKDFCQKILEE